MSLSRNPTNPFAPHSAPRPDSRSSIYSEYIPITRPTIRHPASHGHQKQPPVDPPPAPLCIIKPPAPFIRGKSHPFPLSQGREYPKYPYPSRTGTCASSPRRSPPTSFIPETPGICQQRPHTVPLPERAPYIGSNPDPGKMYYDVVLKEWRGIPTLDVVGSGGVGVGSRRDRAWKYGGLLMRRARSLVGEGELTQEEVEARREELKSMISAPLGTGRR